VDNSIAEYFGQIMCHGVTPTVGWFPPYSATREGGHRLMPLSSIHFARASRTVLCGFQSGLQRFAGRLPPNRHLFRHHRRQPVALDLPTLCVR
jgi:hypothetical protein